MAGSERVRAMAWVAALSGAVVWLLLAAAGLASGALAAARGHLGHALCAVVITAVLLMLACFEILPPAWRLWPAHGAGEPVRPRGGRARVPTGRASP